MSEGAWERVATHGDGSWYLDPLAAEQKRLSHLALLRDWSPGAPPGPILKTDLFEEANGRDELISSFPAGATVIGMDVAPTTVASARDRSGRAAAHFVVADSRRLGLAAASIAIVFSNSTLDHFETREELAASIRELVRVLRPGGRLIVTLDNPKNPLYGLLRWACRRGLAPFVLGQTASIDELTELMRDEGLEVAGTAFLIHNPRLISTAVFLALRRVFGRYADLPVRLLLALFAQLGRLPTRGYTACFIAACGRKETSGGSSPC